MKNIIFSLIFAIFLIACAKDEIVLIKQPENIDFAWWKAYKNEELNTSLKNYFKNNYELKNKKLNQEFLIIENNLLGNFNINAKLGANTSKSLRFHTKTDNFNANLSLDYELDLSRKIALKKRAKMLEIMSLDDEMTDLKQQNAHKITTFLLNKQYIQNTQILMQKQLLNLEKIYEITKEKYDLNKISTTELLDAKSDLDNAKIAFEYNNLEMEKINRVFSDIDFKYDGKTIEILEFDEYLNGVKISPEIVFYKFETLAKNKKLKAKNVLFIASERDFIPSINLSGFLSSSSNKAKSTFDFGVFGASAGVNLGFLDYQNVKNRVKLSEIDYKIALNEYENYLKTTFNLIQNTIKDYFFYKNLLQINEEILKSSKQNYEKQKLKYELKMVELKDFLLYENAYLKAQMSFEKAVFDLNKSKNDILKVIGFYPKNN